MEPNKLSVRNSPWSRRKVARTRVLLSSRAVGNGKDLVGGQDIRCESVSQAHFACALCIWQLEALGLQKRKAERLQSSRQIHFIRAEIKCIFDLFKFCRDGNKSVWNLIYCERFFKSLNWQNSQMMLDSSNRWCQSWMLLIYISKDKR